MKFTNMMGALLASVSFGAVLAVANPTVDAQASAKMSLASAPKKFQGTWYYYQNGHYNRYTIAAKKTSYRNFKGKKWDTGTNYIKSGNLNKNMKNIKKGQLDTLLYMSKGWLLDENWGNHTKASAMGTPGTEGYKIVSRHYKGKTIKSLYTNATWNVGNGEVHLQHYYKTKGQAKTFNPTGASEDFTD